MEYVIGFLFSTGLDRVVLIKKNRPSFLAGKLNGVGGKIEPDERPIDAMRREFFEETGFYVARWLKFNEVTVESDGGTMHCFLSINDNIDKVETRTDEPVAVHRVSSLAIYPTNERCRTLLSEAVDVAVNFQELRPEA